MIFVVVVLLQLLVLGSSSFIMIFSVFLCVFVKVSDK